MAIVESPAGMPGLNVRNYSKGEVIIAKGDYGSSMFIILSGRLCIIKDQETLKTASSASVRRARAALELGRRKPRRKGFLELLGQVGQQLLPPAPERLPISAKDLQGSEPARKPKPTDHPFDQELTEEEVASLMELACFTHVQEKAKLRALLNLHARLRREGDVPRAVLAEDQLEDIRGSFQTDTIGAELGRNLVGEISARDRIARTATVFCDSDDTQLLEMRWEGVRELIKTDPRVWKEWIDGRYRENSLKVSLRNMRLSRMLSPQDLETVKSEVGSKAEFVEYGEYRWSREFKEGKETAREPLIAGEGSRAKDLLLLRAGFARLSQAHGCGERTLNYLNSGQSYGVEEAIIHFVLREALCRVLPRAASDQEIDVDAAVRRINTLRYSLRAIGYAHVVRIPTEVISDVILRPLRSSRKEVAALVNKATAALEQKWDRTAGWEGQLTPALVAVVTDQPEFQQVTVLLENAVEDKENNERDVGEKIGPELMEFFSQGRFINGTKAMVIDLDRCTRCDDCVRACASAHDNNPRFLRHGPSSGRIMLANACMHCADPVCMLDCPTGAIHRIPHGEVFIDHKTCVGCKGCYNNCPYEAIRMVEVRDDSGDIRADEKTHAPILKATKCDLCVEQNGGPACQRACPHGALARMDLTDLGSIVKWLG